MFQTPIIFLHRGRVSPFSLLHCVATQTLLTQLDYARHFCHNSSSVSSQPFFNTARALACVAQSIVRCQFLISSGSAGGIAMSTGSCISYPYSIECSDSPVDSLCRTSICHYSIWQHFIPVLLVSMRIQQNSNGVHHDHRTVKTLNKSVRLRCKRAFLVFSISSNLHT